MSLFSEDVKRPSLLSYIFGMQWRGWGLYAQKGAVYKFCKQHTQKPTRSTIKSAPIYKFHSWPCLLSSFVFTKRALQDIPLYSFNQRLWSELSEYDQEKWHGIKQRTEPTMFLETVTLKRITHSVSTFTKNCVLNHAIEILARHDGWRRGRGDASRKKNPLVSQEQISIISGSFL